MTERNTTQPEPQQPEARPQPETVERGALTGSGALDVLMHVADNAVIGTTIGIGTGIGLKVGDKLLDRPKDPPPSEIELPAGVRKD